MSDNKKYYYIRLKENFFESEEILLLEDLEDGYKYSNILLKLYLRSLKNEGKLMYRDSIPYSTKLISKVTGHSIGDVERALKAFQELKLIEVLDNGAIYMLDIQTFIGETTTEAERKKAYRNRIKNDSCLKIETNVGTNVLNISGQMSDVRTPEIEINKEKEKEIDIDKKKEKREKIDYQQIADMYNNTCVSFPRLTSLSDARKKSIKARMNTYSIDDFQKVFDKAECSSFMKGKNDRNWSATFDWMMKDSNIAKILDGNYDDKENKLKAVGQTEKQELPAWLKKTY